jgi:F-type H+-transporting ATPase subunit gamma
LQFEISGKRGISAMKFRKCIDRNVHPVRRSAQLLKKSQLIADRLMEEFTRARSIGSMWSTRNSSAFESKWPVVETLLPFLVRDRGRPTSGRGAAKAGKKRDDYEFLPSAESILEEVVPASFRVKLFKCFLDAAVSEQIARMVAMKSATENAGDIIKQLSRTYNRARQSQDYGQEIMEIIGGVEALKANPNWFHPIAANPHASPKTHNNLYHTNP